MKKYFWLIVSALSLSYCSDKSDDANRTISVTVLDETNNSPIDKAIVELRDLSNIKLDTFITNSLGHCSVKFEPQNDMTYEIRPHKSGYFNYLSDYTINSKLSSITFGKNPIDKITLYLTSDSMRNSNFFFTIK